MPAVGERKNSGDDLYIYDEQFRDSIGTVDEKGKRIWVYAKKPEGSYHRLRLIVTVLLLSLLFSGPFLRIHGQPLLLLNIFERKFIILGQAFWPQDFVLLAIMLLTFFVFIILFTVVFGRIWCGWMCPQTLFMEMVFRKIEYWLEGDASEQRRLNNGPLNGNKIWRKGVKHLLFVLISVLIAHTSMAYLIGTDETWSIITDSPSHHLAGFIGLVSFTGIFYSVFAFFREQVCIAICPYGRLQGVLLIKDSIVVAYDWIRGEPRGKRRKALITEAPKGDCIDCKLCVHVCPTGIDIRNGTQLECVNCTACMDACDEVMFKINKPKGLIRYASHNSIQNGVQKLFTTRVMAYSIVLIALVGLLSFTLATRSDIETTVFKVPGTLYQRNENGIISNLYNIEFVNKTFNDLPVEVKIESPSWAALIKADSKPVIVPAEGLLKAVYFIQLPADEISKAKTEIYLGIYQNKQLMEKVKVKFIGPVTVKHESL